MAMASRVNEITMLCRNPEHIDNADVNVVNAGTSEQDLLGAFVDGELRGLGIATAVPFGPNAGTYAFLTLIYSNQASGETVTFKFYDVETDAVYDISETIEFVGDMTLGNVVAPEILNTSGITSDAYATCDGDDCDDVDQDGLCDDEDDCVGEYDACGICNGDGIADGTCDCDGNVEDCAGECGGSAVEDECGVCGGCADGYSCNNFG